MSGLGRGRIRAVTGHRIECLSEGWELSACAPGAIGGPRELSAASLDWLATIVPSTAASALRAAGRWSLDGAARRFDADDWWYRTRFTIEPVASGEELWICFDGLATVADVWLNGEPLFCSSGMFVAHEYRIDHRARRQNEIVIRFRSLDALLGTRRSRPRWRAPMVEHQQLRWFRGTLLGRTPGWSPPAAPVGPWRGVRLERRRGVSVDGVQLTATGDGVLDVSCEARSIDGRPLSALELVVERDGKEYRAPLEYTGDKDTVAGRLTVPEVERWWPHTHGVPARYTAQLHVRHGGARSVVDLGSVGFRTIELVTEAGDFAVRVNGVPVFCRGACWSPIDPVSLSAEPGAIADTFAQVVDAGMNMLRIGGTMVYESDDVLDACDAHGVLLWQDFMFANMDYPEDDAGFIDAATSEVRQELLRLQGRPSVAVLCGNSEGEQQAAMWGATRERWGTSFFTERLAAIVNELCPGVPYTPSSAHGGAFPHQVNVGASSYYGVGAYLRPLDDARRAEVRFASECLAFANVPSWRAGQEPLALRNAKVHHPAWKARTPRDLGAGWDFDDVRDHYLASLFRVDPLQLRASDHDRYLSLGRVATGEVIGSVFAEWRRRRSVTRGGLVWFLRDLWAGAGWGLLDATGAPKAAWYYAKRAWAPIAMSLSDEGTNGIAVHVVNDAPVALAGELELALWKGGDVLVARASRAISVEKHDAMEINGASLFEGFFDLSYAYRFGPPSHDLMAGTVRDASGTIVARAFHFTTGLPNNQEPDVGLTATLTAAGNGAYALVVTSRRFAQSVAIDLANFRGDDNYFHLAPGSERRIQLQRIPNTSPAVEGPCGTLQPLNSATAVTLTAERQ